MPSAFSDLAITLFIAAVGVLFGWLLRGASARRMTTREEDADKDEVQRAREVLSRLHELADQVAADVGEHSYRVEAISEELTAADVGESDVVVKAVAKLVRVNSQMQQRLDSAEGKLQEQARQIQSHATAARTDALTGLANRRALDDEIARRYAEFRRNGRTFSVVMLDVDHFKKFNDTHGHQAGDEVLRGVGRVLRRSVREMDLPARYGGEEFAVILPGAMANDVSRSVERIRAAIEDEVFRFEGAELRVTVSLGVAHLLIGEDAAALVQRADAALYASKDAGRNCGHWHDGDAIHPIVARQKPDQGAAPSGGDAPAPDGASRRVPKPQPEHAPQPGRDRPRPEKAPSGQTAASDDVGGPQRPGLCNRTEFCIVAGRRLAEWHCGGPIPSVLLIQIDRLPEIVSRHGQEAGNLALRATGQFLAAAIREMDLVAHYDDLTCALLLPDTPLAGAIDVAERLRQAIAKRRLPVRDGETQITISLGGAEAAETDDLETLLVRAEEALDVAMKSDGNCGFFHDGGHCETAVGALRRLTGQPPRCEGAVSHPA